MTSSVWAFDHFKQRHEIDREKPYESIVFLCSPYTPSKKYDELHNLCKLICADIEKSLFGTIIRCERADSPSTPVIIHQDIWSYIQQSDALIFDISDKNPNVMFELGVASAIRDKEQIILIKDSMSLESSNFNFEPSSTTKASDEKQIFDIQPARYLSYTRGFFQDSKFIKQLRDALIFALAPAPYNPKPLSKVVMPITIDQDNQENFDYLLSPASSLRSKSAEGLIFGSLNIFKYSWLTLGSEQYSNIHINTTMKFQQVNESVEKDDNFNCWIGISLRNQHFAANYGHLIYVKTNGEIIYCRPNDDIGNYDDEPIGILENFTLEDWINFDILFTSDYISISINDFNLTIDLESYPFKFNAGLVRFQTFMARGCVKSVYADIPES